MVERLVFWGWWSGFSRTWYQSYQITPISPLTPANFFSPVFKSTVYEISNTLTSNVNPTGIHYELPSDRRLLHHVHFIRLTQCGKIHCILFKMIRPIGKSVGWRDPPNPLYSILINDLPPTFYKTKRLAPAGRVMWYDYLEAAVNADDCLFLRLWDANIFDVFYCYQGLLVNHTLLEVHGSVFFPSLYPRKRYGHVFSSFIRTFPRSDLTFLGEYFCVWVRIMRDLWPKKISFDRDRTRTCNLRIRSPTPYPLGHTVNVALTFFLLLYDWSW